jgi:hypothetical protein
MMISISRPRRLIGGFAIAMGLSAGGWTRLGAQSPLPGYASCAGQWSDESRGVKSVANCRKVARDSYIKSLELEPAERGTKSFTIDPITKKTVTSSSFWFYPNLSVRVININPYLYEYEVKVTPTAVTESAPLAFFRLIIGALPTSVGGGQQLDFVNPPPPHPACTNPDNGTLAQLLERSKVLSERVGKIDADLTTLRNLQDTSAQRLTVIRNPKATSADVQRAALELYDAIGDHAQGADVVMTEGATLRDDIARFTDTPCTDATPELRMNRKRLSDARGRLKEAVESLGMAKVQESAASSRLQLARPLTEPESFHREVIVDGRTGSKDVAVEVKRRPIPAEPPRADAPERPWTSVVTAHTNIGIPKLFSLSGGLATFASDARTFAATRRYTGDITGPDTVATVISEASVDRRRLVPMAVLGAKLPIPHNVTSPILTGVGLDFGITVGKEATTFLEYFVGASVHFFDDRVFLAYGEYAAKEQSLADGLALGDRIPGAQTTVPTVSRTRWHDSWMLGIKLY